MGTWPRRGCSPRPSRGGDTVPNPDKSHREPSCHSHPCQETPGWVEGKISSCRPPHTHPPGEWVGSRMSCVPHPAVPASHNVTGKSDGTGDSPKGSRHAVLARGPVPLSVCPPVPVPMSPGVDWPRSRLGAPRTSTVSPGMGGFLLWEVTQPAARGQRTPARWPGHPPRPPSPAWGHFGVQWVCLSAQRVVRCFRGSPCGLGCHPGGC